MLRPSAPYVTPTTYVVDDDDGVRESLKLLVDRAGLHAETFASARELLAQLGPSGPSCLILDVALPDVCRLDLQKRIVADRPDMPIIIITGHADVTMAVEAMKAGAFEFLMKPFDSAVLLDAIRRAIERSRSALACEEELHVLRERHALLTSREREVMALIVAGRLNKEVGFHLGITEITVKAHRGNVMRKMQASSFADLVRMAITDAGAVQSRIDPRTTRMFGASSVH
jgi:FixJ family two-component response regulator